MSPDRVNAVFLVRGVVPDLRVFRDPVDFLEHLEVMDPRSDIFKLFIYHSCYGILNIMVSSNIPLHF